MPSGANGSAARCRSTSTCRAGAFYIDDSSDKIVPVMLHRAMFGSIERFTGILIEHHAGHFPLWLAPLQVVVATITSEAKHYARVVAEHLSSAGLRVDIDLRNEKIGYKVREHSHAKVPVMIVLGKREVDERAVNIRRLGSKDQESMSLEASKQALRQEALAPDERGAP